MNESRWSGAARRDGGGRRWAVCVGQVSTAMFASAVDQRSADDSLIQFAVGICVSSSIISSSSGGGGDIVLPDDTAVRTQNRCC